MKTTAFIVFSFSVLLACNGNKSRYVSKDDNGGDNVYTVTNEDKEMNVAIAKAVSSYDDFLRHFKNPDSNSSDFAVKVRFDFGENDGEHMWLTELRFKDNRLFGILDSDPINKTGVKAGDSLEINRNLVSDWMYLNHNKLVGGFTIKALYNKMSEKEKDEFRSEVRFQIE